MAAFIDITGQRFGKLEAVGTDGYFGKQIVWRFNCDCGGSIRSTSWQVRKGRIRTCGCSRVKSGEEPRGPGWQPRSKQRLYAIWGQMKDRCVRKKSPAFRWYGARGIAVCGEWTNSYSEFRDWAEASGYADHLQIDRIDPDGNYEPANCRWVDAQTNNRNRRCSRKVLIEGEVLSSAEAAKRLGVSRNTIINRIANGKLKEPADA